MFQIAKLSNIGGTNIRVATRRVTQSEWVSIIILVIIMYVFLDVAIFKMYHLILFSCSNYMVILLIVN